jgi:hypothetical protein
MKSEFAITEANLALISEDLKSINLALKLRIENQSYHLMSRTPLSTIIWLSPFLSVE